MRNHSKFQRGTSLLLVTTTVTALGSLSFVTGCKKNQLASTDTVRTGDGANAKFLVPVPVGQPDGSNAFCVYVAGASTDLNFYSSIGPGNSQNTQVLTAQAIPQADFLQQLRVMPGVGGMGNDIANDVMTMSVAFALGTTALGTAGVLKLRRDNAALQANKTGTTGSTATTTTTTTNAVNPPPAGNATTATTNAGNATNQAQNAVETQARLTIDDIPQVAQGHIDQLDRSMAQVLELEDRVEKISRDKVTDLTNMLKNQGGLADVVDAKGVAKTNPTLKWFESAINGSKKKDFENIMLRLSTGTDDATVQQLAEALAAQRGNSPLPGGKFDVRFQEEAKKLIDAINKAKAFEENGRRPFTEVAGDVLKLKSTQETIRNQAVNLRNNADDLGKVLNSKNLENLNQVISDQRRIMAQSIDDSVQATRDIIQPGVIKSSLPAVDVTDLKNLAERGGSKVTIDGFQTASVKGKAVISEASSFSDNLLKTVRTGATQNVDNTVTAASNDVIKVVSTKVSNFANEGAAATKGLVNRVCFNGGKPLWRVLNAAGCGLIVAGGAVAVKKFAVEPLTAAPKLEQITRALSDVSQYQNVNEQTFGALATGISRFQSSVSTSACQ